MNREVPVAFCGGLMGRFRHSTHYSLHWTLDMTFNEDYSRIRLKNAAENMAMIRHTALNLLKIAQHKFKKYISMNGLRKKAGWDDDTLHIIIRQ